MEDFSESVRVSGFVCQPASPQQDVPFTISVLYVVLKPGPMNTVKTSYHRCILFANAACSRGPGDSVNDAPRNLNMVPSSICKAIRYGDEFAVIYQVELTQAKLIFHVNIAQ